MRNKPDHEILDEQIARFRRKGLKVLSFAEPLESRFEQDTAADRAHRLWLEGLIAILFLTGSLIADYLMVRDPAWKLIISRTMMVTPIALLVNLIMRVRPSRKLREGSVAIGITLICYVNLYVQGNKSAATTTYGLICVLITVLFADVVMRLRFPYAAVATLAMSIGALRFLVPASGLPPAEKTVAASLLAVGVGVTALASYSLELQERLGYLLQIRSELQELRLLDLNLRLSRLSFEDQLTGLPNRRAFAEKLQELWLEGQRLNTSLSAIIIDVDHFKVLNDRYGHLHGDKVLQGIGESLLNGIRGERDFAARFGGEEFVVLLPNTEVGPAMQRAEELRASVQALVAYDTDRSQLRPSHMVTISCGVSTCIPSAEISRDELLTYADRALYHAKANGRNRVDFLPMFTYQ